MTAQPVALWDAVHAAPRDDVRFGVPNTGRLFDEAAELVARTFGRDVRDRALLHRVDDGVSLVLARSNDLPYLLDAGIVDTVLTGSDYVAEAGVDLTRVTDLGIMRTDLCLLVRRERAQDDDALRPRVVVTQYPRLTTRFFATRPDRPTVLAVSGAAELYPLLGYADAIVDNVMTGTTSERNGLVSVLTIMATSAGVYTRPNPDPRVVALLERLGLLSAAGPM